MLSFLRNKHVIVAMFVAPILAVITWYAVDNLVAEKPHAAQSGSSYRLVAMSNCRYQSGVCTLKNNDVKVKLRASAAGPGTVNFILESGGLPITRAVIATISDKVESEPVTMQATDDDTWSASLPVADATGTSLRFAMNIDEALYFTETGIAFIDYETTFPRDNFSR